MLKAELQGRTVRATAGWLLGLAAFATIFTVAIGAEDKLVPADRRPEPKPAPASDEAAQAIRTFVLPSGFKAELVAAEPLLANPVAFCFDEKGRIYVAETHRSRTSALDIRDYLPWLDEDFSLRTAAEREAMLRRRLGDKAADLAVETEAVRRLEDRDADGVFETSTLRTTGFNSVLDGTAGGILARKNQVWFGNIPNLWLIEDTGGTTGANATRKSLGFGYGVHLGLPGHDLRGLVMGPDGRIYFGIGDRGARVNTPDGKVLDVADEGAVFRCNPDGSQLELFASGLRNPVDLVFDDEGNLFTADNDNGLSNNNNDRWVHLVEGGDSGWRSGFNFCPMGNAGVWTMEKMGLPEQTGQPAWIIPPVANIAGGSSGIAHYSGSALPTKYDNLFFIARFNDEVTQSGVGTISLGARGAGFELVKGDVFLRGARATDVDFGPDGAMYISAWGRSRELDGTGRIYRIYDPIRVHNPAAVEAQKVLREGLEGKPLDDLSVLLGNPDRRVRLAAQFAMVEASGRKTWKVGMLEVRRSKDEALKTLLAAARSHPEKLGRMHAIWGVSQISRQNPPAGLFDLTGLLNDREPEIRAQVARVLGEGRFTDALPYLIRALKDPDPRARCQAAMAVGKIGRRQALEPVFSLLRNNKEGDLYVRHAGVMALVALGDIGSLASAAKDSSPAVRMGAVLALRRLRRPEVARFLKDKAPEITLEAARAIHDAPIDAAMPQLVLLIGECAESEPLALRVINASYRVGAASNAVALAQFAMGSAASVTARAEAIQHLADWPEPPGRDRVSGLWRPLPKRAPGPAADALRPHLDELLKQGPAKVQIATARAAAELGLTEAESSLRALITEARHTEDVRAAAKEALERIGKR